MAYLFNGSRNGKSEFTNVSEKTEIYIPSQQRYEIIIACVTSLVLSFINVLLLGKNVIYYIVLAAFILSFMKLAYSLKGLHTLSQIKKIKKIYITLILFILTIVWFFAGHKILMNVWPTLDYFTVRYFVNTRCYYLITPWWQGKLSHSFMRGMVYIRIMLFCINSLVIAIQVFYAVTLAYDMFVKNDQRHALDAGMPSRLEVVLNKNLRRATYKAFLDTLGVEVNDIMPVFRTTMFVNHDGGKWKKYDIDLTDSEWGILRQIAINDATYSAAGLSDYGFTSGSNGKARRVNQWLKGVDGLLEKDGKKLKASLQFKNWLINEAWRDSEDLPVI